MNRSTQGQPRVLAIAPSTRGFGFAVLENEATLVDWGVKSVTDDKNARSLAKVKELIVHYEPGVLVLPDTASKDSRRAARIRSLCQQIKTMAETHKVRVVLLSQEQVRRAFFTDGRGTKHGLAEILAKRFPEELGSRLPPKRRPWMSEDYRMDIFEAVALALMHRVRDAEGRA